MSLPEHVRRCAELSAAIAPLIEAIDDAVAFDYRQTFRCAVRLDAELADAREPIRRAWALHHERTRIMREERERVVKTAATVLCTMSPWPIIVTYRGEPVRV